MPGQLRPPSPRINRSSNSGSTTKDATIQKVDTFSTTAESDAETTISLTSSEGSPPSNIRNVSTEVKGKQVSGTSVSRPEGYAPVKRVSKNVLSPVGTSNRQSNVVKRTSPSTLSKDNTAANKTLPPKVSTKRTSAASMRSSGGWDTLAKKSTGYRNSSSASVGSRTSINKKNSALANKGTVAASSSSVGSRASINKKNSALANKGTVAASSSSVGSRTSINKNLANKGTVTTNKANPKNELIAKLNKQVEMLQEKQKKADANHQKTTQHLEAKLDDLRMADSILIGQLRSERNDLKEQLDQANDRLQSIGEEHGDAMQKELALKGILEQQLAEAHARIGKLSEQAMDDHFGGSKIDMLRERRRTIEAQMSQGGQPNNNESAKDQLSNKPENRQVDVDMERVMKNLKDELEASKQVIVQQKEQLRLVLECQDSNNEKETTNSSSDDEGEWKARFLEIQKRHLQLECDRAWSEFQLRNRITNDSLKFNRRLKHWKDRVQDVETKLDTLETIRSAREQQQVPEVAPLDDSSGGSKSTEQPPERGWWGFRK
ncbi:unnamed protein product [Cylindrotheca closterium]|uniref:Uncharacterized protein n=1 Tax=Cylindrotheca closterium TaxID=2856 RepID=A0AAD2FZ16_9STRA|nr:unnamed protein product [Cylindrotheca closterium]